MKILPWKKHDEPALILIPKEYKLDLEKNISKEDWNVFPPSDKLASALRSRKMEELEQAFDSCESLFKRAYEELKHSRYLPAARTYLTAGRDYRGDIWALQRWGRSFEDNLALEVYNDLNFAPIRTKIANSDRMIDYDQEVLPRLPSQAPCLKCGTLLARPTIPGQKICPKCGLEQNYAEKETDRIMAGIIPKRFGKEIEEERKKYLDVVASFMTGDYPIHWHPLVYELIPLIQQSRQKV